MPPGWEPVEDSMYETALARTELAFTGDGSGVTHAVDHLSKYYNPAGGYSGSTFLEVEAYDEYAITAADLWAVSTLQMSVPPETGRALMHPGPLRTIINSKLRHLPTTLPLSDVTPAHLEHMRDLQDAIRSMVPALGKRPTNQWVLAAKICARKRPMLFPVRDSKVCEYLANKGLGGTAGRLGWFTRDIQVLAYLVSHPRVRNMLDTSRQAMREKHPTWSLDWCDLRLLDAVLWMQAARR